MRIFGIINLVIVVTIVSCRKEELIPIDETKWEDPKVIDGLYFKGIITEKDKVIPYVVVEVYQNEKKVGETKAREDGSFDTRDIKLEEGKHVTFNFVHEGYIPYTKRKVASEKITNLGKIHLSKPTQIPAVIAPLENPGSNDLIIISGYVTTPDGQAAQDVFVGLFYDIVKISPTESYMEGAIVYTDENGYYDVLLPKDQVFEYLVLQQSSEACGNSSKILTKPDFTILDGIPVERIGPFTEDTQLPSIKNATINIPTSRKPFFVKLNANFLNCDNQAVKWGSVTGSLEVQGEKRYFNDRIGLGIWLNDSIGFCINPFLTLEIKVSIKVKDNESGKSSEELAFVLNDGQQNLGDILVCTSPPIQKSTIQLFIKDQNHTLELGTDSDPKNTFISNDTLFAPKSLNVPGGSVSFYIPNYQDYNNIKLYDLTFIINDEDYTSVGPVRIINLGGSPGNISGLITNALFKNRTTGEIIELNGLKGSVYIQY